MSDAIESCGCESEPHQCVEADPAITMLQADLAARDAEIARLTAELAAARAVPPDVAFAIDTGIADFIDVHAKRIAGDDWALMDADDQCSVAAQVHDVLNHLRGGEDGAVIDGRASQPATVGGLLATAPVGSAVDGATAEIERLTAELAAARAVPPDVAAAIGDLEHSAFESGHGYGVADMAKMRRHADLRVTSRNKLYAAISAATASHPATAAGLLATEADALLCRWYAAKQDAIGAFVDLENLRRPDPDDSWSGGIGRRDYMTGAEKRAADTKERLVDVTNKVIAAMTRGPIGEVPDAR